MIRKYRAIAVTVLALGMAGRAAADESLLGYVSGIEALPEDAWELEQRVTYRYDKGRGACEVWTLATAFEYGVTSRFTASVYPELQAIDTERLVIDGSLPRAKSCGPEPSGVEATAKYMFLSPALHDLGPAV